MWSCFCHGSIFICLLLPENMIICDKCLSKCGKRAKLNDLRLYNILRCYYILHGDVRNCIIRFGNVLYNKLLLKREKHKEYRDQFF